MTFDENSSSEDMWADFEAAENPKPRTPEMVLWDVRFQEADEKVRNLEVQYRQALFTNGPAMFFLIELDFARKVITELHEERRRMENNG